MNTAVNINAAVTLRKKLSPIPKALRKRSMQTVASGFRYASKKNRKEKTDRISLPQQQAQRAFALPAEPNKQHNGGFVPHVVLS